ncbi:MAG: TetR/AcrR family transcriptional regulator [Gemmataceae bacterium]|nr:TetR/AcrR family transcriptional regulator [Gemmataceae bacterium]
MKSARIDVAGMRREQIIQAAVGIIAAQGLQNLSLSEIEKAAGMSRGQLTYYYRTKEAILLAVFDRLLELMYQRIGTPGGQPCEQAGVWDWVRHLLATVPAQPQVSPEFHCLQYTFLAQMGPREDFRKRLASLYEEWRGNMARGFAEKWKERPPLRSVSPRAVATLVQALLHGLAMQAAADPSSLNCEEMLHLCLDMLGTYLQGPVEKTARRSPKPAKSTATNGTARNGSAQRAKRNPRVKHA